MAATFTLRSDNASSPPDSTTRLSIEAAKRLPPPLCPWRLLKTFYVTSSPIEADDPAGFRDWSLFYDMLRRTDRLEVRLGRREGPRGSRGEKGVDTLVTILGVSAGRPPFVPFDCCHI